VPHKGKKQATLKSKVHMVKITDLAQESGVPIWQLRRWFHEGILRGVQGNGARAHIWIFRSSFEEYSTYGTIREKVT